MLNQLLREEILSRYSAVRLFGVTIESGRVPILLSSFFSFVGTFAAIVSRVAFEELLLAAVCAKFYCLKKKR